jgi:DHA1 family tetracycline resistance protein-like MFS transporter
LYEKFGFRQAQIGEYFAFIGVWIALVQGVVTPLVTRWFNPRQIVSVSFLILSLALAALMLPEQEWQLYALTPLVALGMGLSQPNTIAIVSSLANRKSQGEILGINQSVQSLAIGIPPLFAGFLAAYSIYLPIVGASVFVFCAWLVFVVIFLKQPQQIFEEA